MPSYALTCSSFNTAEGVSLLLSEEESGHMVKLGLVKAFSFDRGYYPVPSVFIAKSGEMKESAWKSNADVDVFDEEDEREKLTGQQQQALDALREWLDMTRGYTEEDWKRLTPRTYGECLKLIRSEE